MNEWFDAEQRIERAHQLCESQRWEAALAEVEAALEINPDNALWHAQRGFLLERYADAVAAYRRALDLERGEVGIAVSLGIDLTREGHLAEALQVFAEITRRDPAFEPGYCHQILVYAELGQHDKAEEMFYLAQQITDDNPHAYYNMGISLAMRGDLDRAIWCWKRTLELDSAFPKVNRRIAQAYRSGGDVDRARAYYLAELREDPGDVDLLLELGRLEAEAGNFAQAVGKLTQVIDLEPDNAAAHVGIGEILLRSGHPQQALESLRRGLSIDPEFPGLDLRLGEAYLLLARYAESRRYLDRATRQDPRNESAWMALGNCLLQMGKPDPAADMFRRVIAIDAQCPYAYHNLGVCHFLNGRYDVGLQHCLRAIELKPDYVMAMHKAALAYIRLRQWTQAREIVDRELGLEPDHEALRQLKRRLWRHRLASWVRRLLGAARSPTRS
jgi:tetratricopeptide (TPR) repeat protein